MHVALLAGVRKSSYTTPSHLILYLRTVSFLPHFLSLVLHRRRLHGCVSFACFILQNQLIKLKASPKFPLPPPPPPLPVPPPCYTSLKTVPKAASPSSPSYPPPCALLETVPSFTFLSFSSFSLSFAYKTPRLDLPLLLNNLLVLLL